MSKRDCTSAYNALAEWTYSGWTVHLTGLPGPQRFRARDLADVEPRALKLIWGYEGIDAASVDLSVAVRLPSHVQDRLHVIREQSTDLDDEYQAAIAEMTDLGLSLLDISRVLKLHNQTRPLTITNAEIAHHGLDRHPAAIGVEWADHGFALTRLCRSHVDRDRAGYGDLEPAGLNALVYSQAHFRCDRCEGDDMRAWEHR